MSIQRIDQLNRGARVAPPVSQRKMDFFDSLPLERFTAQQPFGTRDKSLYVRLNRGYVAPKPQKRIIDSDRDERIHTAAHGMKILFSSEAQEENRSTRDQLLARMDSATNTQIRALATAVGVPLTGSINSLKASITQDLNTIFTSGIDPSKQKQDKIIKILEEIRDNATLNAEFNLDDLDDLDTEVVGLPQTITPNVWLGMDDGQRNTLLRNAEVKYLEIPDSKVEDADKKFSKHKFITSASGTKITIDGVKQRMNKGNAILNLKHFRLEKP